MSKQEPAEKPDYAKIRGEHQRLSEMIVEGTHYHEPVKVQGIDRFEHAVDVYPLSDQQFREIFESASVDPRDVGNQEKLLANMKFLAACAAVATRDADIARVLLPNETAKIVLKTFELSGLTGLPKQS